MHIHTTIKTAFEKRRIDVDSREGHHTIQIVVNQRRFISLSVLFPLAPANRPWVSEDVIKQDRRVLVS